MKKSYGGSDKKAKQVFYSSINKGNIEGAEVNRKKRKDGGASGGRR